MSNVLRSFTTSTGLIVQVYKSKRLLKTEYRWRAVSGNGRKIANSGEGYSNQADCDHAIELIWSP